MKLPDLIFFHTALFMHDFYSNRLPIYSFKSFFEEVKNTYSNNTRLAAKSSFTLLKVRTNYGKFNIKYSGAKIWNTIDEAIKDIKRTKFQEKLKNHIISSYEELL